MGSTILHMVPLEEGIRPCVPDAYASGTGTTRALWLPSPSDLMGGEEERGEEGREGGARHRSSAGSVAIADFRKPNSRTGEEQMEGSKGIRSVSTFVVSGFQVLFSRAPWAILFCIWSRWRKEAECRACLMLTHQAQARQGRCGCRHQAI